MADLEFISNTRSVYDATAGAYVEFAGTTVSAATETSADIGLLERFVDELDTPRTRARTPTVADLGCGPGRVAAVLAARGLAVVGVDLAPTMLAVARDAHPEVAFAAGALAALPIRSRSLTAAVSWYSIIHTPPEHLGAVCAQLARVLGDDGRLLVAFQAGDGEGVVRENAYGTGVDLTSYRHSPRELARHLLEAGLHVVATVVRAPELAHETTEQAFVTARKGASATGG